MTEVVVFPFVEKLLRAALLPLVGGVAISTRVPKERPSAPFVRLTRVGGPRRDRVTDQPMVVVEVWGPDEVSVGELAERVRAHVFALEQTQTAHGWVRTVREVGGLQSFPDPVTGSPRYQFTVQLDTRGAPL
jgi:hypothetical protein